MMTCCQHYVPLGDLESDPNCLHTRTKMGRAVVVKSLSGRYLVKSADNRLREVPDTISSELHCNRHMVRSHRVRKGFEASCPASVMCPQCALCPAASSLG